MIRGGPAERPFARVPAESLYCAAARREPVQKNDMSKQDTHFFNVFSMVIGLLVAIAIGIFALARIVASQTQDKQVVQDAEYVKNVQERVAPFSQEAVAGQDNTALAIKPDASAAAQGGAGTPEMPKTGEALFQQTCSACHGAGIAGA